MKIADFSFQSHGIDNCQYFPGAGIAFTEWHFAATGVGNTEYEAAGDALDYVCQGEDLTEEDIDLIEQEMKKADNEHTVPVDMEECYYYVTLFIKWKNFVHRVEDMDSI